MRVLRVIVLLGVACGAMPVCMPQSCWGIEYEYSLIAEASFAQLLLPFTFVDARPSLSARGAVAFEGTPRGGPVGVNEGVYIGSGGEQSLGDYTVVVQDETNDANDLRNISIGGFQGSSISFSALNSAGQWGVYVGDGVAQRTVIVNPEVGGSAWKPSVNSAGVTSYRTRVPNGTIQQDALVTASDGVRTVLTVRKVGNDPGGPFSFIGNFETPTINNAGQVLFHGDLIEGNRSVTGLYRYESGGAFTPIVQEYGSFGEEQFRVQSSGFDMNNRGGVAFRGTTIDPVGEQVHTIVKPEAGFLIELANSYNEPTPGQIRFFQSDVAINDLGDVAFWGAAWQDDGSTLNTIYIAPETPAAYTPPAIVLAEGDPLFGSTVRGVNFGRDGFNNKREFAFRAQLDDGRLVIGLAKPKPDLQLVIDWDSPLSKKFELFTDAATNQQWYIDVEGNSEALEFIDVISAAAFQQAVEDHVCNVFFASGLTVEILNEPTPNVLSVRFGNDLARYDGDGDGTATDRLLGVAFDIAPPDSNGIDQFDLRKDGEVAVFVNLAADSPEIVAETVVHEAAHGWGIRHINPDPFSPREVMDYGDALGDIEYFWNGVTPIVEPPMPTGTPEGSTHNPTYHLRRYVVGESHEELTEDFIEAGTWDLEGNAVVEVAVNRIELGELAREEMFNLSALQGSAPGSLAFEQSANAIAFFDAIDLDLPQEVAFAAVANYPIRLLASSETGSMWDLYFGFGGAENPELLWDLSQLGHVEGTLFQFIAGEGLRDIGTFAATLRMLGHVTPDGFVPIPEPSGVTLALLGIIIVTIPRRAFSGSENSPAR